MDFCDIAIVGGGPAGSFTAISFLLRNPDLKIHIYDHQQFPRDKSCGDGIGPGAVAAMQRAGLDPLSIPDSQVLSAGEIFGPGGLSFISDPSSAGIEPGYGIVARRTDFDWWLLQQAIGMGAEFHVGTRYEGHKVSGGRTTVMFRDKAKPATAPDVRCSLLVGADGANSRVRKNVGLPSATPPNKAIAVRAYADIPKEWQDRIVMNFDCGFQPGYGWCFPLPDGKANIGCGTSVEAPQENGWDMDSMLEDTLKTFASRGLECSNVAGRKSYTLPSGRLGTIAAESVALVGDAAHMINPLSGEGIVYALEAGEMLAESCAAQIGKRSNPRLPENRKPKRDNTHEDVVGVPAPVAVQPLPGLARYQRKFKQTFGKHFWVCDFAAKSLVTPARTAKLCSLAYGNPRLQKAVTKLMFGKGWTFPLSPAIKIALTFGGKEPATHPDSGEVKQLAAHVGDDVA